MEIILASSSPHRKKLFSTLNISFKVVPSNVDENKIKKLAKTPEELVIKLAIAKAKAVVRKLKDKRKDDFLVIGADSTAALKIKKGWLFFDKPKNKYEARKMALELKGKAHRFYTGLALISSLGKQKTKVVFSDVYFKNFSNKVLHNYIESKIWHGRAGGYDIKKDKSQLIEKYQGSYTNILGLPLEKLIPLLKSLGVKIEKEGGVSSLEKKKTQTSKKYAGFGVRLMAFLIDVIVLGVVSSMFGRLIPFYARPLVGALYYVVLWVNWNGQTIGKKAMALKVVREDGKPVTYTEAVIRYLGYFVSGLPLLLGFFWVIWDEKKQGWHDKIAKTLVVKE